ncbi:MAG: sulfotransferase [Vicingaceae bacterium]
MPNFFIVGVAKAGTTALANILVQHPEVFASAVKEPNYFSRDEIKAADLYYRNEGVENWEQYLACFKAAEEQKVILEASVSYFTFPSVAVKIKQTFPNAKVLIILREPIERAISHYLMDQRLGYVQADFMEIFRNPNSYAKHYKQYFEQSMYYERCKEYCKIFGEENILILKYEPEVEKLANQICRFLELSPFQFSSLQSNKSRIPTNQILKALYQIPFIRRTFKAITPTVIIKGIQSNYFQEQRVELSESDRTELQAHFKADLNDLKRSLSINLSSSK